MDEEEDDYERLSHLDKSFDGDDGHGEDGCKEDDFKMTHYDLNHSASKKQESERVAAQQ